MNRRKFIQSAGGVAIAASASGFSPLASALICRAEHPGVEKVRNFEADFLDDIYLPRAQMPLLKSVVARLRRVRKIVGHGRFALLDFDGMLRIGRSYENVGLFTKEEISFLENMFHRDAALYGFYGAKVLTRITDRLPTRDSSKVRRTGQYLFRGKPVVTYKEILKKLGDDVVLTSGVRGMTKQFYLFLAKTERTHGNLSRASRSLAPPGFSFHAAGDFDVGKKGWGIRNFSADFEKTDVFKKLVYLGYAKLRYPKDNQLGVRYEPWHIKIV